MNRIRIRLLFLLAVIVLLCMGCGIESYIYLYPIKQYLILPSSDDPYNYFSFKTSDAANIENYANGYFKGCEVFYRIYNSTSARDSDYSAISSYTSNDEDNDSTPSANAYSYLINTKSYVRMTCQNRQETPLIPASTDSSNQIVSIRLYAATSAYTEEITINDTSYGLALRTIDGISKDAAEYTFDYDEIDKNDSDVKYSTSTSNDAEGKWYVVAYAMAWGYDESFQNLYSVPYYLGYVTISDD